MLTLDGHCKTLDSTADGYARAEACSVMLLTASGTGDVDVDAASAVMLCSTYVNQDGRSSSLTAPNGPSQQQVWVGAFMSCDNLCNTLLHSSDQLLAENSVQYRYM